MISRLISFQWTSTAGGDTDTARESVGLSPAAVPTNAAFKSEVSAFFKKKNSAFHLLGTTEGAQHLYFHRWFPFPRPWPSRPPDLAGFHEQCRALCTRPAGCVTSWWILVTPSRFSTLPTLCWTEKGILTSPHIISKPPCFPIWGSYFPASFIFFLLLAIRWENFVCYCREMTQAQSPRISFKHFKRERGKKSLHLNISLRLHIVPVPHWTIYCCWPGWRGGVVFGVTVLQPEDLDSISRDNWNPPCWGALRIHGYKDAALKTKINSEKAQSSTRTPRKRPRTILSMSRVLQKVSTPVSFQRCRTPALFYSPLCCALVSLSEGSRHMDLPIKLYLIVHKSLTRSPNLNRLSSKTDRTVWTVPLIIPWLCWCRFLHSCLWRALKKDNRMPDKQQIANWKPLKMV